MLDQHAPFCVENRTAARCRRHQEEYRCGLEAATVKGDAGRLAIIVAYECQSEEARLYLEYPEHCRRTLLRIALPAQRSSLMVNIYM